MHDCFATVLASGSSGNSYLLKCGEDALLVDVGLSCKEIESRVSRLGVDLPEVGAVLLTHEHTDHSRGVWKLCTKHDLPLFATAGTMSVVRPKGVKSHVICAGQVFGVGRFEVRSFPVKHFAAEPVAYSISVNGRRASIASDLGCVTSSLLTGLADTNLLFLEANYDDDMLMSGTYPDFLKMTIRGPKGHLSNVDAAVVCKEAASDATESVVLVHLSKENNTPDKARAAVEGELRAMGSRARLHVTEHGAECGPFRL